MKTVGIIAEYNPFHNGHAYQLAKAKEITGADFCVVVMSGNYVQRGIPAIMDKFLRTQTALSNGADLVLELPVHYATGSAEYFASGAVALLDRLGVINCLCFGSECDDIHILSELSLALTSESDAFKTVLKQQLKAGYSYPKARNNALQSSAPHLTKYLDHLHYPNNILGLEYLKALKKRNSRIKPYTISREGSQYHDASLRNTYSSALAIRESIIQNQEIRFIKEQVPVSSFKVMEENFQKTFPILSEDLFSLLLYKLFQEQGKGFTNYFDIDRSFSDRLEHCISSCSDYNALCEMLKSKNTTYTKVSRSLLHILLNIYQEDVNTFCEQDYVYYARMLGFRKEASPLLSAIKSASTVPLISKLADAAGCISPSNGKKMLDQDILASHIYDVVVHEKFHHPMKNEYTKPIVVF